MASGALGLACTTGFEHEAALATAACATEIAGDPWRNQTFAEQAGRFHVELDATASLASIDAVIGLGNGPVSAFEQLGPTVRFNPGGMIDVRDGAGYRADVTQVYEVGKTYHLRLDVDVHRRTYSVWLRDDFGGYTALARDYAFRTEQANVTRLSGVASKIDATTGTFSLCNVEVVGDATTADGCLIATAGDGPISALLPDASVLATVTFTVTPSGPGIDAVIGLSAGPAAGFADLATGVRFAPGGVVDARDGDGYRADLARPYATTAIDFRMIADVTSHTYSVFEGGFRDAQELARQYRFRPEQAGATHLDRLSAIVDGTEGSVTICHPHGTPSRGIAYSREGTYAVLPVANDQALVSDGATTRRLDAGGHVIAELGRGGALAADPAGNLFVARVAGATLTVESYDPGFAPRWTAMPSVPAGSTIAAIESDPAGGVRVATISRQDGTVQVTQLTAGGGLGAQRAVPGEAVALDGAQPIVAWNDAGTLRITRFDPTGAAVWSRAFAGQASITAIAVDPGHDVVFGGELVTAIDFGGGVLPLRRTDNGPLDGFIVKLAAGGAHQFSRKTGYTLVGGIASNGSRIAVSSTEQTQFHIVHYQLFDASGAPMVTSFDTGFGENGFGGAVAIGPTGRVWWNLVTQWPLFPSWPYLVVLNP
ncbi:MAG TPA: hypothetical protein VGD37_30270 [Kofleriaceae bacterium]